MLFLGLLPGMGALRRRRGAELLRIPGGELGQSEGLFANTQKPDACVVPESRNSPLGSSAVRRCIAAMVTLQAIWRNVGYGVLTETLVSTALADRLLI